jgi:tetratricopeptide (TPR) repeat protein/class 3 adenylate cyclase
MKNFIPNFIAEKASENNHSGIFAASTMFIDISGFTSMTQSLMGHGKEGAEVLSNIINNIFTPSIKAIYDNGGFVSTFAGDAFTAIFETAKADHALNAAFEINKLFVDAGKIKTKFGEFELAVKIGLSHGEVEFGIIDAEVQKAFYFRGEAVDNCAKSEHHAEKMQVAADGKFIEKLSVQVEKQPKGEQWFILTPKELELSPIQRKPGFVIPEKIEKMFVPDVVLNMKDRGEFREIVSVFIVFEESDGYTESIKHVIKNTHAYGGYFNKIDFGDKGGVMLVIFGAPTGREKLYSRAAEFALSLKQMRDLKFRIGISTGIAFCGIVGSDLRKEYTALGNVVNLSARLMMKAEPYQTLTGPQIKSKLPAQYEFENKGLTEFKGFHYKIEIFSLRNKTAGKQQLSYSGSFVGRKKEADELKKMIRPIYEEKFGGIIYIDGPAGIGKSRFIDNFVKNLDNCHSFYLPCDEVLRKSFNPFEYFFKGYFEQSEAVSKEENKAIFIQKYTEIVSRTQNEEIKSELIRTESVIGALIGLEWQNSLYAQLDAKGKYENTIYAVKNFFLAQSLFKPVVLVLEDGHWIDSDSLALVQTLIRNVEKYPIVILALCRPNDDGSVFNLFDPEKLEFPLNRLNIESFNKEMMNVLLKDRFSSSIIPDKTSDFVWEKSNGNPFFVEQLVLYLTENNLLDESLNLVSEANSIPSGISQIIIARIDRLSAEMKETVKTASVLGREFALRVLEKMLGSGIGLKEINILNELETGKNDKLWENLTELKYIFKHALIRETVYEIQLKETLRKLHDLAGNIIEDIYSDNIKEHFEELADHYDKAENEVKAIEYIEKAGDKAKDNYHNDKALDYFDRLILKLENKDQKTFISVLLKKGSVLELTGMWDEALETFEKAKSISLALGDKILLVESLNSLAGFLRHKGELENAAELLETSLKTANEINYTEGICEALSYIATIFHVKGDFDEALRKYEENIKLCEQLGDKRGLAFATGNTGLILMDKGDYESAMNCFEKQLNIMEEIGNREGIGRAFSNMASIDIYRGDYQKALELTQKEYDISKELGDRNGIAYGIGNIGAVYSNMGDYKNAMDCFDKYFSISEELGDKYGMGMALCNIGMIFSNKGDNDKAMECHTKHMAICEELNDRMGKTYAYGNLGTVYQNLRIFDKAIECFEKKIAISEELGNVRGIGEAYGNIGMIYSEQGNYDEALVCYDKQIEISTELEDPRGTALAKGNVAIAFKALKKYEQSADNFKSSVKILRDIGDTNDLCIYLNSYCELLIELSKYDEARILNNEAQKLSKELDIEELIKGTNDIRIRIEEFFEKGL